MPELPEVETTLQGIRPHLVGQRITGLVVRDGRLRWPIPQDLGVQTQGLVLNRLSRRGKYILGQVGANTLLFHLGMSGSLRIVTPQSPPRKHDHYDFLFENGVCLRYHDPRRFGCLLAIEGEPFRHPLLRHLGPEPLEPGFDGRYLSERAQGRSQPIKAFLMDSKVVVGVGNIYANEALFLAGIHPNRAAGRISKARFEGLAHAIREVLSQAITMGGTTLRDFVNESGQPGYFSQTLRVYGRGGEPCRVCETTLKQRPLGQRATYWCPCCQH